jgi:hypothetical protein
MGRDDAIGPGEARLIKTVAGGEGEGGPSCFLLLTASCPCVSVLSDGS